MELGKESYLWLSVQTGEEPAPFLRPIQARLTAAARAWARWGRGWPGVRGGDAEGAAARGRAGAEPRPGRARVCGELG